MIPDTINLFMIWLEMGRESDVGDEAHERERVGMQQQQVAVT